MVPQQTPPPLPPPLPPPVADDKPPRAKAMFAPFGIRNGTWLMIGGLGSLCLWLLVAILITGLVVRERSNSAPVAAATPSDTETVPAAPASKPAEEQPPTPEVPPDAPPAEPEKAAPPEVDNVALVRMVDPSVVTIETKSGARGSGFILAADGTIATNYHVMAESQSGATVILANGDRLTVEGFLNSSSETDLILLHVLPEGRLLTPLAIADQPPERGSRVWAFGAPQGLAGTVTDGMMSGLRKGHELRDTVGSYITERPYGHGLQTTWLQVTAPISPGNSGGPLVDKHGKVVGVNSWLLLNGQNLNFAVSAEHVRELLASAPTSAKPLRRIPKPRPDPAELAAKQADDAKATQLEDIKRRIAAANKLEESRQRRVAIESERNRITVAIATIRKELALIEAEGTLLTSERAKALAAGQVAQVRAAQITAEANAINYRLAAISQAIQRRQVTLRDRFAPIHTDGERATFDQAGIVLLQVEAIGHQNRLTALQAEGQSLASVYAGLDLKARELQGMIQYKAAHRLLRQGELLQLQQLYQALPAE